CTAKAAEYQALGKKLPGAQRTAELLALSLSASFDYDCHRWQYDLAPALIRGDEPLPGYRDYLFAQLATVRPEEVELLLPIAISGALRESDLSRAEWRRIVEGLAHMRPVVVGRSLSALSTYTVAQREGFPEANYRQSTDRLGEQMEQLLSLAHAGKIAKPALTRGDLGLALYKATLHRQPVLAAEL